MNASIDSQDLDRSFEESTCAVENHMKSIETNSSIKYSI